jgi:hypothetical protein
VHAADVGGDVHVHDVPVRDHRVVRDAVADDLVQGRAQRLGITPVAQRARVGAAGYQVLVPDPVQLIGGHARDDVPAHFGQRSGRQRAGHPHPLDRVGVLDIGLAQCRVLLADVLGPGDVGRDLPERGKPAGLEHSRHGLEF